VFDFVLVVLELLVLQDLQWRTSYAASVHAGTNGYTPSFSYNVLTRVFTMSGNGPSLVSPLTLDWVQLLAIVLVVVNVWLGYATLSRHRAFKTPPAPASPATAEK